MADPSQVVLLSPDSSEAARHLDTKNDTAPPSRERERRRIEIQEVFVFHTLEGILLRLYTESKVISCEFRTSFFFFYPDCQ